MMPQNENEEQEHEHVNEPMRDMEIQFHKEPPQEEPQPLQTNADNDQQPFPRTVYVEIIDAESECSELEQHIHHHLDQLTYEQALVFINEIKATYTDRPEVYEEFAGIMMDYKRGILDIPDLMRKVTELFADHLKLLMGFDSFLPTVYKQFE